MYDEKFKIQNGWEEKGHHCCEGGNTVTSSILPSSICFCI